VVADVTGRTSRKLFVDDTQEGARLVTLNDSRYRNAVDAEMMDGLVAAVGDVASWTACALVITEAGPRSAWERRSTRCPTFSGSALLVSVWPVDEWFALFVAIRSARNPESQ
jgi:hypothetical protein